MAEGEIDFSKVIDDLAKAAGSLPGLESLRATRALLTSAGFARQLDTVVSRSHNQPGASSELANRFRGIKFSYHDLRSDRRELYSQVSLLAVGGGSTLAGGAIVAAATAVMVYPPLAVFTVMAGGYAIWRGTIENRRLALEISCLDDIVEAPDSHIGTLEKL